MGDTSKKPGKHICLGIVAHVDAGKTTLSEAILYKTGAVRKLGRVDNRDAFLDTYEMERARGITIFSKQAEVVSGGLRMTLLDTPGHVDFSAEMERTLQVLDYAILVINGADGVQGHTETLWRLLKRYQVPVFLFVNKMDQAGTDKERLLGELKKRLDSAVVDFSDIRAGAEVCGTAGGGKAGTVRGHAGVGTQERAGTGMTGRNGEREECLEYVGSGSGEEIMEEISMCREELLEEYLETGAIGADGVREAIRDRKIFPCYFGSALKLVGMEEFLAGIEMFSFCPQYPDEFGAKVYKISRDDQGNRLTHLKITGGSLKVKGFLDREETEKVNQIRLYSGAKFETAGEVEAGRICAVTGPAATRPGQGFGIEAETGSPLLEPVLTYQVILPPGLDGAVMLKNMRILEEEDPQLHVVWNEALGEIEAQVMGEVQMEILKSQIKERFHVDVKFGSGNIVYKETIARPVEGVGHFEPLRHYAEVHLIMEPLETGSGLVFETDCSEDVLDRNWQRLILTHLEEKRHRGVLTGSEITDMKITLTAGRSHLKHTEGGDFRQATYRAVRQGLMEAGCRLLEPYYEFTLEVPAECVGRAMSDIERMQGKFEAPEQNGDTAVLKGIGPVATMRDYQKEVVSYTKGRGHFIGNLLGYEPCHNESEVVAAIGYDFDADLQDPAGSVFCAHGAGFTVPWDEVKKYMHVETPLAVRRAAGIDLPAGGAAGTAGGGNYSGSGGLGAGSSFNGSGSPNAGGGFSGSSSPGIGGTLGSGRNPGAGGGRAGSGNSPASGIGQGAGGGSAPGIGPGSGRGASGSDVNSGASPRLSSTYFEDKELEEIFTRTYGQSKRSLPGGSDSRRIIRAQSVGKQEKSRSKEEEPAEEYLLVDGYNIIFAWDELNDLAATNIEGARYRLMDILCNYQGYKKCTLIVVFDAYKVVGNTGEALKYHNIHVVYTKEAETADQYIEKLAHRIGTRYNVTVATSDGLEQLIIRGQGCRLLSARDLKEEVEYVNGLIAEEKARLSTNGKSGKNYLLSHADQDTREYLENVRLGKNKKKKDR